MYSPSSPKVHGAGGSRRHTEEDPLSGPQLGQGPESVGFRGAERKFRPKFSPEGRDPYPSIDPESNPPSPFMVTSGAEPSVSVEELF